MIAESLDQSNYGINNYRPLAAYILRVAYDGRRDPLDWGLTSNRQIDGVAWAKAVNSTSQNLGWAIKEADLVQQMNKRAVTCKSYHYVVSFPEGEQPSRAVLENIESVLSGAIGYGEHQRIMAVHTNTDHLHMHVAVNRVHPETFRCIGSFHDHFTLQRETAKLEVKHDLVRDNHEPFTRTGPEIPFVPSWLDEAPPPALDPDLAAAFKHAKDQAWQLRKTAWDELRTRHLQETARLVAWYKERRVNARAANLNLGDRISTDAYLRDHANVDHAERKLRQKQEREALKQRFPLPSLADFKLTHAAATPTDRDAGHAHDRDYESAGPERFANVPDYDPD